jgi:hypothetical protein
MMYHYGNYVNGITFGPNTCAIARESMVSRDMLSVFAAEQAPILVTRTCDGVLLPMPYYHRPCHVPLDTNT